MGQIKITLGSMEDQIRALANERGATLSGMVRVLVRLGLQTVSRDTDSQSAPNAGAYVDGLRIPAFPEAEADVAVAAALAEVEQAGKTIAAVKDAHRRVFGTDPGVDGGPDTVVAVDVAPDGTMTVVDQFTSDQIEQGMISDVSAADVKISRDDVSPDPCRIHRTWERVNDTWFDKGVERETVRCQDCGHEQERRVAKGKGGSK